MSYRKGGRSWHILPACLLFTALLGRSAAAGTPPEHLVDQQALLSGVTQIAAPGLPGPVAVFGPDAFPLVVGKTGDHTEAPVAAASRLGTGRVVALGHPGYLDSEALGAADTGTLVLNAVHWLSASGRPVRIGVRQRPGLSAFLRAHGMIVDVLDGPGWPLRLGRDSVVSCPLADLAPPEIASLGGYVRSGGGLLAAELGWGWLQLNPGKALTQHGGDQLFAPAGLLWADGTLDRTTPDGFAAGPIPSPMDNASVALDTILAAPASPAPPGGDLSAQAFETVLLAARTLPPADTILLPRLNTLLTDHQDDPALRLETPITSHQPIQRLALTLAIQREMHQPADKVQALPAAASFPGSVPSDAPRVTRTVAVDTGVPDWHSTGLYAAPGEPIAVTLPSSAAGHGLQVRIGAHTDTLWQMKTWDRAPEITRVYPLKTTNTEAANAFGGPIYIVVPDGCTLGTVSVTVSHVIEAPYFIKGKTDLTAWQNTIRQAPAPWAELQGDNVILIVPSAVVRTLDDPQALMTLWDHILDGYADFAGIPHHRLRPERYCIDRQISAGYMHSGYPIMTGPDVAADIVSTHVLLTNGDGHTKSWGFFHEMGHNHQKSDWTFDGTGEVTNNVFDLYILDTVCGITAHQHPALEPAAVRARLQKYIDGGADFAQWKSDPFLALTMYIQLQQGFGWDAYKRVFAEYDRLSPAERPKTDLEKRDQWMTRFSRAVGRNLGPFFQAWGVPTSPAARAALTGLPSWMPPDFPTAQTPANPPKSAIL
jgi:hypothetical protein